jgi:O-antigen ligase
VRPSRSVDWTSSTRALLTGVGARQSRGQQRVATRPGRSGKLRIGALLGYTYFMWFVILWDPQWFIASLGPQFVLKIPTGLFAILLVLTIAKGPRFLFPPLLAFLVYTVLSVPFAYIRGGALELAKALFAYYVITLASLTVVRNAREAVPIVVAALAAQFTLWVVAGARSGFITWHYAYANSDSFGPLMVLGMAGLTCVGLATKNRTWRILAFLLGGGCVVGLVVSFARGAVLSAGVVGIWIWARSPNKLKTAALGVGAFVVLAIAARVFQGAQSAILAGKTSTNFWEEMGTAFNPNDATRQDRQVLWHLALRVYASHPLLGVGPNAFGPYAADHFAVGTTGGAYDENPKRLWGRALHNSYYQILSEFGTVGAAIFLWIVWDFFKRNRKLRHPQRRQAWALRTGGQLDLRYLSIALEASMVGFLLTAYFYNQIFDVNWFYVLLTINALLYQLTRPQQPAM